MSSHCHNYLGPECKREETSLTVMTEGVTHHDSFSKQRALDAAILSEFTTFKKNASSLGLASTATGHDETMHIVHDGPILIHAFLKNKVSL